MNTNFRSTVEKWYAALSFDPKYDDELEALLEKYPSLPCISMDDYTFEITNEKSGQNLLMCLYFCEELEQKYKQKGLPEQILKDSLRDIVIWTDIHYELWGVLGISEIHWIKNTLTQKLFRLGRLQFMLTPCRCDIADLGIKKGEPIMDIHIPRGGKLLVEECLASIESARAFFAEFFPEMQYKCFACESWLLDDTLINVMREDSNIIKFGRLFTPALREEGYDVLKYTINWNATIENVGELKAENALGRRVLDYISAGGKFYMVTGYIEK